MKPIPAGDTLSLPRTSPRSDQHPDGFGAPELLPPSLTAVQASTPVVTRRGRSVLVIDDEAGMRVMARAVLEAVEYKTEVAESGEEALEVYRARWQREIRSM
jgi:hypothetical protein